MRRLGFFIGIIALAALFLMYRAYSMVQNSNVTAQQAGTILLLPQGTQFEMLLDSLESGGILKNTASFRRVARWMNFGDQVKPGRYLIMPDLSNRQLINLLRSGSQHPVNLTINNVRTLGDLAAKVSERIATDSTDLHRYFLSPGNLKDWSTDDKNVLTYFIPNTYQVFWNMTPAALSSRMLAEHQKFWQAQDRLAKAKSLGLTTEQVYTLASIVEKETQVEEERPIVAGLYLNRLKQGIRLQADPTVVFAVGQFDLRRVLHKHLAFDSPYNTYLNAGLPPGPICMPSISSIDGVLDRAQHDYLYMCARPDNSGRHAFANSLAAHNRNANTYRNWLNERGIR